MPISGMLIVGATPSVIGPRAAAPPPSLWVGGRGKGRAVTLGGNGAGARSKVSVVECSSRPQKKATSHHMKTRPKKTQPWDIRRKGPTSYPPLPTLPPDWTLASPQEPQEAVAAPPAS